MTLKPLAGRTESLMILTSDYTCNVDVNHWWDINFYLFARYINDSDWHLRMSFYAQLLRKELYVATVMLYAFISYYKHINLCLCILLTLASN